MFCFFFNSPATTELYTLSLHDALPICLGVKLFAGAIRRISDSAVRLCLEPRGGTDECTLPRRTQPSRARRTHRSEEHTSELQSLRHLVCRLLLEKKKTRLT